MLQIFGSFDAITSLLFLLTVINVRGCDCFLLLANLELSPSAPCCSAAAWRTACPSGRAGAAPGHWENPNFVVEKYFSEKKYFADEKYF